MSMLNTSPQGKIYTLLHQSGEILSRVLSPNLEMADAHFKRHWSNYWTNFKCAYFESVIVEETSLGPIVVKDCR